MAQQQNGRISSVVFGSENLYWVPEETQNAFVKDTAEHGLTLLVNAANNSDTGEPEVTFTVVNESAGIVAASKWSLYDYTDAVDSAYAGREAVLSEPIPVDGETYEKSGLAIEASAPGKGFYDVRESGIKKLLADKLGQIAMFDRTFLCAFFEQSNAFFMPRAQIVDLTGHLTPSQETAVTRAPLKM